MNACVKKFKELERRFWKDLKETEARRIAAGGAHRYIGGWDK